MTTTTVILDPRPQPRPTRIARDDHLMPRSSETVQRSTPKRRELPDRAPIDKALADALEALNMADQHRQAAQRRLKQVHAAEKGVEDSAEALRQARVDAFDSMNSPEQQMALGEAETRHRDIVAASEPALAAKPDILARLQACETTVAEAEATVEQARAAVAEADRWESRLDAADMIEDAVDLLLAAHQRLIDAGDHDTARSMRSAITRAELVYDPLAATAWEVWTRPDWVRP